MLVLVCSDTPRAWSDASADDIASMKETMKTLLQPDTSDGNLISVSFSYYPVVGNGVGRA